jgi:DNA-binding MarR family transcriptional regulator
MTKLNPTQESILTYCKAGKTSDDITKHFNYSRSSVYNNLGTLQKLGYITRQGDRHRGRLAVYVSLIDVADIQTKEPEEVAPQSDLTMFVARAHDPFNLSGTTVRKSAGFLATI